MAYCPECGAEFGGGMRRCPECLIDLLEELEDPNLDENPDEDLVVIRESASPDVAARIREVLNKNGILSVVEDVTQSQGRAAAGTAHVFVNKKDEVRSRDLLKEF